jgi:hypothetical protein
LFWKNIIRISAESVPDFEKKIGKLFIDILGIPYSIFNIMQCGLT